MDTDSFLSKGDDWMQINRQIKLQGAYNVRDLGGYPTSPGGRVVCSRVYRSDDLSALSERDMESFSERGIVTVVDFRAKEESLSAPNKRVSSVVNWIELPIDPGNVVQYKEMFSSLTEEKAEGMMKKIYKALIMEFQNEYREFFALLMKKESTPVLFHCSAGKDRTGVAAALFLLSLGVDKEIILEDYMESKENAEKKYEKDLEKCPALYPLITVKREYLQAAFDEIEGQYGSVENYLQQALSVDLERMRSLYVAEV